MYGRSTSAFTAIPVLVNKVCMCVLNKLMCDDALLVCGSAHTDRQSFTIVCKLRAVHFYRKLLGQSARQVCVTALMRQNAASCKEIPALLAASHIVARTPRVSKVKSFCFLQDGFSRKVGDWSKAISPKMLLFFCLFVCLFVFFMQLQCPVYGRAK